MSDNAAEGGSVLDFLNGTALVPGRDCGECAVCCRLLDIAEPEEIAKPSGEWCKHCTQTGCAIHETRPSICRTWFCAWRQIGAMPDEARPDRLGVMFHLNVPDEPQNILAMRYIRGISTGGPDDFDSDGVREMIDLFRTRPVPVWLDRGNTMTCVHPVAAVQAVLIHGQPPSSQAVADQAGRWRSIYEELE